MGRSYMILLPLFRACYCIVFSCFSFIFLKGLLFLLRQRVGGCGCGPPASLFDCATVCLSASLTCSLPTGVEEFRAFVSPAKKLPTSAAGLAFAASDPHGQLRRQQSC